MSSIVVLFTTEEKTNSAIRITAAPRNAPVRILTYPPAAVPNTVLKNPPKESITTATPRLAPVDMPRIDGPASGLLNAVCSNSPATARAAPENAAVHIIGNRASSTITCHA